VNRLDQRIMEAEKLGFQRILIPDFHPKRGEKRPTNIEVISVRKVEDAFRILFGK
jgi:DNA repair protein RadA/Sms